MRLYIYLLSVATEVKLGFKQIYVLERDSDHRHPGRVIHQRAFGGMGFGDIESSSFAEKFNIIAMDEKTVTVQCKDETV